MSVERDRERLPESNYNAEYPHNQVEVSSGGHEFHVDNTPGARRIRQSHASGTYDEISEGGRRVSVTVGTNHEYHKAGSTVTTDGNSDVRHNGHARLIAKNGLHSEVGGDSSLAFGGKTTAYSSGEIKIGSTKIYIGASGEINIVASGKLTLNGSSVEINGSTITLNGQVALGGTGGQPVEVVSDTPATKVTAV